MSCADHSFLPLPTVELLRPLGKPRWSGYDVIAELHDDYSLPRVGNGDKLTIKKGFLSDGASIPRFAWWLTGPPLLGRYAGAAFGHDLLCREAECYADRLLADAYFYWWMERSGVSWWKRTIMYIAVRLAAFYSWRVTTEQRRNRKRYHPKHAGKLTKSDVKKLAKVYKKLVIGD